MSAPSYDVVVPTVGRASLLDLLDALAAGSGPAPGRVLVVDDSAQGLSLRPAPRVEVLRGRAGGPAAARNLGWLSSTANWIAFLDDDVVPDADWRARLAGDLAQLPGAVAGSQGRLRVPLPAERRPTDWERNTRALETARWATADLCCRRSALAAVGGFDERFPRAYREDADLALRLERAGFRLVRGRRTAAHPVRAAGPLASVRVQAGNADDALMQRLHGRGWRESAGAPRGRLRSHAVTTFAGGLALAALVSRRHRLAGALFAGWLGATAELAWRRIAPGPRTPGELATMALTSALIPPVASYHRLAGTLRARRLVARPVRPRPDAVLLDRDGTLIADVPFNGEPARVRPLPGARAALEWLRAARIPLAVVSNQSGVGRGLITAEQLAAVNRRVEELVGPIDSWAVCTHAPHEGCACRKPAPGLVHRAAAELGVDPSRCALIGDIGADVEAARAAGARAILVPTAVTRSEEIESAPEVAATLGEAVHRLLGGVR